MTTSDYIVSLDGATYRKAFFAELLAFFAAHQVILTTWGTLPAEVRERLATFRAPCSRVKRLAFHQAEWHVTPQSLAA